MHAVVAVRIRLSDALPQGLMSTGATVPPLIEELSALSNTVVSDAPPSRSHFVGFLIFWSIRVRFTC